MGIFDKRVNYKPFEYLEIIQFTNTMHKSFWTHDEVDFTADIQDYKTKLDNLKREVHKRSILSIAQTEVTVKGFWGDLYKYFPKPEFNGLGSTFAHNEFIHSEAYSQILTVNGYEDDFIKALENPIFKKYQDLASFIMKDEDSTIIDKLLFFTLVIEDSSLFSKFANVLSFTHFEGLMKNTSNIISWTSLDEINHSNAGIWILNKIREEGHQMPSQEWINSKVEMYINNESEMLDWIFEKGELPYYTKSELLDYMKFRLDASIEKIGYNKVFNVEMPKKLMWFEEEVFSNALDDFFAKRPVEYTKHDKSITENDLF